MASSYTLIEILTSITMTKDALKESIGTDNDNITDYSYLIHNQKVDVYNDAQERGYQYVFNSVEGDSGLNPPIPQSKVTVPGNEIEWDGTYDGEEGLIYIMGVVKDAKLAMKSELDIDSYIFSEYPYYITYQLNNAEDEGYHHGVETAYNQVTVPAPIITGTYGGIITITSTINQPIYYKIDNGNEVLYTDSFTVSEQCTIYARVKFNIDGVNFSSDWASMGYTPLETPTFVQEYNHVTIYKPSGYNNNDYTLYYSTDGFNFTQGNNGTIIHLAADTVIYAYGTYEDARSVTVSFNAIFTPWIFEFDDNYSSYMTYGEATIAFYGKMASGIWDNYANMSPAIKLTSSDPSFNPYHYSGTYLCPRYMYRWDGSDTWRTISYARINTWNPNCDLVDASVNRELTPGTIYTKTAYIAIGQEVPGDGTTGSRKTVYNFERDGMAYSYIVDGYTFRGYYSPINVFTYNYDTSVDEIEYNIPIEKFQYRSYDTNDSAYGFSQGYTVGWNSNTTYIDWYHPYLGDRKYYIIPESPGVNQNTFGTGIRYKPIVKTATRSVAFNNMNYEYQYGYNLGYLSTTEYAAGWAYATSQENTIPGTNYFDGRRRHTYVNSSYVFWN